MNDADGPPTPKLTGTWQRHSNAAIELANEIQRHELGKRKVGPGLDPHGEHKLRAIRQVAELYSQIFARWSGLQSIPLEQKQQELREFNALSELAQLAMGKKVA